MNKHYIITRHFVIVCTEQQYNARTHIPMQEPLMTVEGDVYQIPHQGLISFTGVLVERKVIVKYDPSSLVIVAP